jgi:hypothetical protein
MVTKKTTINPLHNKEIKVGYRIVKIKVTPADFNKGHMCEEYGQYHERTSIIDLQDKLKVRDEVNTFVHELLHAILTQANALTALLFDNKWFVQYLYDKVMQ